MPGDPTVFDFFSRALPVEDVVVRTQVGDTFVDVLHTGANGLRTVWGWSSDISSAEEAALWLRNQSVE
jgi:hypothetical protein